MSTLPPHLAERVRWVRDAGAAAGTSLPSSPDGRFVLYWMHHAVRAHENPSLDVAILLARHFELPLLVYHALCEQYPYASDRHHAFILQGARDVQREMADRGIAYHFHLQRCGHRGAHLRDLARRAAIVVSDEMPVEPIVGWTARLAATCRAPIVCVDASCVVPLPLADGAETRAVRFRQRTERLRSQRLSRSYEEVASDCRMYDGPLPFEPLDLQRIDLAEVIAYCQIDHGIAPVADTPGGSRAGYQRWADFLADGLSDYSQRRVDPTDPSGSSRLSAYLHYGMVSPLRIARQAAGQRSTGAEKFLDELVVWREMAFHFCHHQGERIESLDGLPAWARQTLQQHAGDIRPSEQSWETLARGQTGHRLWDACQQSLLRHGQLHNNLRMTWGKALLAWTASPERALRMAIDLNHRYALDGRDPCSYGGILWCFGQFDSATQPERPIYGTVRCRSLQQHARRINLGRYRQLIDRPLAADPPRVAIIGAGIGGLVAARTLADHGLIVRLVEKSRGVGGRLATRRLDDGSHIDHGAQYFTARDGRLARYVGSWVDDSLVAPWLGRIVQLRRGELAADQSTTPRYVGLPSMNRLAKHLANGLDVTLERTVAQLRRCEQGWRLLDAEGESVGDFDAVVVNCPPVQAAALLRGHTELCRRIESVVMLPCWTVMLRLAGPPADFDGAFVADSPLAWICRDSSKPGRGTVDGERWVLHATPDWSSAHLESDREWVSERLLAEFFELTGIRVGGTSNGDKSASTHELVSASTHRWRFAIPRQPLDDDCLWDPVTKLGACGDWCGGPKVEGAFLSGVAMAGALLRDWTIDRAASR